MKKKLVIIDVYSIIYKCFYGVRPMHSPKGVSTNAIFGFLNIILKLIEQEKPNYLYAAFDKGHKNFRHEKYSEYKAGRQSMPEELREQLPYIDELLDAANIISLKVDNYEADDIIGSVSEIADSKGIDTVVITGDRDSFQLVSEHTKILYSKRGISDIEVIDEAYIMDKYSLTPKQMIDLKALMGDKSDNIPGVKGVGEKTALGLLEKYKTLEGVYENIDEVKGKLKEKLINDKDNAFLSKELGSIVVDMDVDINLEEECDFNFNNEKFISILSSLDLKSIMKKLGVENNADKEEKNDDFSNLKEEYLNIGNDIKPDELCKVLEKKDYISIYFVLNDENNKLKEAMIFDGEKFYLFDLTVLPVSDMAAIMNKNNNIITHDFKNVYKCFKREGYDVECSFDTYIGGYVLNPSDERYSLEVMGKKYLDVDLKEDKGEAVQQSFLDIEDKEKYLTYIKKAKCIYSLYKLLNEKIKEEGMEELYNNIEHKLMYVLADMEIEGFKVDVNMLEVLGEDFDKRVENLTKQIRELAGEDESFNVNSTKQLGHVLFEKLNLPVIKKTKTGYSTNIEVLEKLKDHHPIIPLIIELRQVSKLNSTYVKGFVTLIDRKEDKIHSTFNQTITTTGRISSSNPNLQNIPVRTNEGRIIRKVFIPSKEGNVLVDADYSQIELRVLAHISSDEKLINAFKNNEDIHARTASEVFGVNIEDVTSEMRSRAKAVNFGIVYGISDFGLSKDLNISRKNAKEYIDTYLAKYPNVSKYMKDIVEFAKENGYVTTMFNRRRYINEIHSKNFNVRSFGERTALNTPIQGSAADIIKLAMINVESEIKKRNLKSKLILQVHDELIIDAPENEVMEVKEILKDKMENAVKMDCPLKADINVGKNWFEAK
ncbi:DNA polymerase I [Anaerofustis sp. NSJ-163]|uniref:DNA polymerase I n=1 Tax=Anaerofustis sp. NSJ-163 TaxID=2944391 RepID=UPI00209C2F9B|nr:DNA polymerase I [Anaerofustis sp. NSJ-163]MCO8194371.1 DNA polymerase I [Anaerofustis sp. NSJ-163]